MEDQVSTNFLINVAPLGFGQGPKQDVAIRVNTRGILDTAPAGGPTLATEIFLDRLKDVFKLPGADIERCRQQIDDGKSFDIEVEGTLAQLKQAGFVRRNT